MLRKLYMASKMLAIHSANPLQICYSQLAVYQQELIIINIIIIISYIIMVTIVPQVPANSSIAS